MDPSEDRILQNILKLLNKTGYDVVQRNGQRYYGPPPNWIGPAPKGCEIFIGKIPRDCYEDELVPIFEQVGTIYELRLMMDFSGHNRGFGFVRYTNVADAHKAVEQLNNYRIRSSNTIVVTKSIDNDRLFVGGLPFYATKEEVLEVFGNLVSGIVDVLMYPSIKNSSQNRGFVFLQFDSHHSAALARRALIPGPPTTFGGKLMVDWAEPEPVVDENVMKQVKVLFVRRIPARTSEHDILKNFSRFIDPETIERVKKIDDYAFVHFTTRQDAEKALQRMKCSVLDGCKLELKWARPVDRIFVKDKHREAEKIQTKSLMLRGQNINFRTVDSTPENNNFINFCAASSPDILDDFCKRMNWGNPKYEFRNGWVSGVFYWSGSVLLQAVRLPNYYRGTRLDVGPFESQHLCYTQMDVVVKCSEMALDYLKGLDFSQLPNQQ